MVGAHTSSWLAVGCMLLVLCACSQDPGGPYDVLAEPDTDLKHAMTQATAEGKLVLVVFGANWCEDCRALERQLKTDLLHQVVADQFVLMHVDIGNWDKNMDFVARFGKPVDRGIPSIAIVDRDGGIRFVSASGELAKARRMTNEQLAEWISGLVQPRTG
jgi:thioredoxin 1